MADTSSCGRKVSSVNRRSSELLPTLELPISKSLSVGISCAILLGRTAGKKNLPQNANARDAPEAVTQGQSKT